MLFNALPKILKHGRGRRKFDAMDYGKHAPSRNARIIKDIQTVDHNANHVNPKTNLKRNDNAPTFLFTLIKS